MFGAETYRHISTQDTVYTRKMTLMNSTTWLQLGLLKEIVNLS